MGIVPTRIPDLLQWAETHGDTWTAAPATIGLTAAQVTAFKTKTANARGAVFNQDLANQAKLAATTTVRNDVSTLRASASDLIAIIKGFAENSANPAAVYAAAQIPPPAPPTPVPAPGKPNTFAIALESDGSVTLSWEATNSAASSGAFFTISRKLPGQTAFTSLGGASGTTAESRRCFFTDATIPASAASAGAQYIVQGFRGTRAGTPSDAIIVQFGNDGATFSSASNAGFKLAA